MFTESAQRGANRTAARSQLSGDWRREIDSTPRQGNNATSPMSRFPAARGYLHQHSLAPHRSNEDISIRAAQRVQKGESIRGEDDPRTHQAIVEGRRLYVGNLPYMAKPKDIEALFSEDGYSMFELLIFQENTHILIERQGAYQYVNRPTYWQKSFLLLRRA